MLHRSSEWKLSNGRTLLVQNNLLKVKLKLLNIFNLPYDLRIHLNASLIEVCKSEVILVIEG